MTDDDDNDSDDDDDDEGQDQQVNMKDVCDISTPSSQPVATSHSEIASMVELET